MTGKAEVKKFMREEMQLLWRKMGPYLWRRRAAEDLQVANMEVKQLLLKRMEDPATTEQDIEEIYSEIEAMERTDQYIAFEGKNDLRL